MTDLEMALRDLGDELDYPAATHLATRVRARIAEEAPARRWAWRPAVVWALAVVVLAAGLGLWAPARRAVADFFGLPGVFFSDEPAPVEPGTGLRLGEAVGMADARQVPFRVVVPLDLGPADAVYIDRGSAAPVVSLVYEPADGLPEVGDTGAGLLLSQFPGRLDQQILGKFVGPDGRTREVTVGDRRGYWVEGPPHVVLYLDPDGEVREDTARLAGHVLLWDDGGVIRRLESALPLDAALRIASSVR